MTHIKFNYMINLLQLHVVFFGICLSFIAVSQGLKNNTSIGSISSAHPLATRAGFDILEKGGNAFDAAIAVASTLNVVEPMMSGIGGYGTILIYDAESKQIRYLNPSGRFPAKTNTDLMREPTIDYMKNRIGPKSISTPGNLNAWASMHKQYGQLKWETLFTSAIDHAEKGYLLTPMMANSIASAYKDFSSYTKSFYGKDNEPLKAGDKLIQTDLGRTFRQIANDGVSSFYSGSIARAIDFKMTEIGSFLTIEDLKANVAEWGQPLKINYKGYDVFTASLPANSFAAFVNIGLMQQFRSEKHVHNSPEYLHLFAEMTKQSYKARLAFSFDPEIKTAPIDSILSSTVLYKMASSINREMATKFEPPFIIQRVIFLILTPLAYLFGYRSVYKKYLD